MNLPCHPQSRLDEVNVALFHIWNNPNKRARSRRSEAESPSFVANSDIWGDHHAGWLAQSTDYYLSFKNLSWLASGVETGTVMCPL